MLLENTPTLLTPRLILRRFAPEDLPAVFDIYSDREANRFLPWFPAETMADARRFLEERYLAVYERPSGYAYAVCRREDNIPIGYVTVKADDSYDLGYGLRKEFWHQGIATEAARAVVEQAGREGIPYITATHDVNNPRSGAVMRRVGMQYQYSYEELVQPKNQLVTFRLYQKNLDGACGRVFRRYWECSRVHFIESF